MEKQKTFILQLAAINVFLFIFSFFIYIQGSYFSLFLRRGLMLGIGGYKELLIIVPFILGIIGFFITKIVKDFDSIKALKYANMNFLITSIIMILFLIFYIITFTPPVMPM